MGCMFEIEKIGRREHFQRSPSRIECAVASANSLYCAAGQFLAVFCVAHFPAKRENSLPQFVAPFPIPFSPRVVAFLRKLRRFRWNDDFRLSFESENGVDPFPPLQPRARG